MNDSPKVPATRFGEVPSLDIRFPALPQTAVEVPALLAQASETLDTTRLAAVVDADPIVAAAVLRRINTAYYGLRRRISDVRQAVALLGFLEVANLALTASMLKLEEIINSSEQTNIFNQTMRASIGASFYARMLAEHLGLSLEAEASSSGLLHALGRLVLLYNKPDDYEALWYSSASDLPPSAEAERTIFGIDHAELGARAADHWKLPHRIVHVLRAYRTPDALNDEEERWCAYVLAAAVHAAEQLHLAAEYPSTSALAASAPFVQLARRADTAPGDLAALAEHERERAGRYIATMMRP